ncbi:hypothetical protein [Clostridium guangxiense]|uniref:hypothetical protein n=1 Tax=Clostridium guangxiense TaxID=1662055 RepID=UPI001E407A30|nr:hypothetical protein [Clostridium guangxiense]MCD2345771.1 hypothetical protein [Clostridium guangxiense]
MKNISDRQGIKEGCKYILANYGFDISTVIEGHVPSRAFILSGQKLGNLNLYKVQFKYKSSCFEMLYCTEDDKIVYLVEF